MLIAAGSANRCLLSVLVRAGVQAKTAGAAASFSSVVSLTLINESRKDELVIVRVQIGRRRWGRLEDRDFYDIGEEPAGPGFLTPIAPGATVMMQVSHHFIVKSLPRSRVKKLSFRIVATDQFGDRHRKRLRPSRFYERP
jgi:hypothetical protein